MGKCLDYEVGGMKPRGRPKRSLSKIVEKRMLGFDRYVRRMLCTVVPVFGHCLICWSHKQLLFKMSLSIPFPIWVAAE